MAGSSTPYFPPPPEPGQHAPLSSRPKQAAPQAYAPTPQRDSSPGYAGLAHSTTWPQQEPHHEMQPPVPYVSPPSAQGETPQRYHPSHAPSAPNVLAPVPQKPALTHSPANITPTPYTQPHGQNPPSALNTALSSQQAPASRHPLSNVTSPVSDASPIQAAYVGQPADGIKPISRVSSIADRYVPQNYSPSSRQPPSAYPARPPNFRRRSRSLDSPSGAQSSGRRASPDVYDPRDRRNFPHHSNSMQADAPTSPLHQQPVNQFSSLANARAPESPMHQNPNRDPNQNPLSPPPAQYSQGQPLSPQQSAQAQGQPMSPTGPAQPLVGYAPPGYAGQPMSPPAPGQRHPHFAPVPRESNRFPAHAPDPRYPHPSQQQQAYPNPYAQGRSRASSLPRHQNQQQRTPYNSSQKQSQNKSQESDQPQTPSQDPAHFPDLNDENSREIEYTDPYHPGQTFKRRVPNKWHKEGAKKEAQDKQKQARVDGQNQQLDDARKKNEFMGDTRKQVAGYNKAANDWIKHENQNEKQHPVKRKMAVFLGNQNPALEDSGELVLEGLGKVGAAL